MPLTSKVKGDRYEVVYVSNSIEFEPLVCLLMGICPSSRISDPHLIIYSIAREILLPKYP